MDIIEKRKKYYIDNRDKWLEKSKEYYYNNKEVDKNIIMNIGHYISINIFKQEV